mmetsp:Transcript_21386/g.25476  ORF Transcript_21386/g.25476 Transcript_21386/m.25476 type:complete len:339 (+) Transcript_21386:101-1117(+)|eukprot:CAMPEP_0198248472 /NCGR_PEP_ID=MMETSP1447-20131203/229_1 /TAXON_ID=420782 /ORGANISM="Chaetoceros dichaeta, Strain CCMP1751" /LENGTH=338 /DNA_ID=CAMNT_0043932867 /DNA_START=76 /DNA_END=1092 /DNA_ORIENTATION=-
MSVDSAMSSDLAYIIALIAAGTFILGWCLYGVGKDISVMLWDLLHMMGSSFPLPERLHRKRDELSNFYVLLFAIPSLLILGGLIQDHEVTLKVIIGAPFAWSFARLVAIYLGYRERTSDDAPVTSLEAENIFESLSSAFVKSILLGGTQITLMAMYVMGIWNKASSVDFQDEKVYSYYYIGVFIEVAYMIGNDLHISGTHNTEFWIEAFIAVKYCEDHRGNDITWYRRMIIDLSKMLLPFLDDNVYHSYGLPTNRTVWKSADGSEEDVFVLSRTTLMLRCLLSTLVNTGGLLVILLFLPIEVASQDDSLQLALGVVAAFYIIELDDLGTPIRLCVRVP